MRRCAFLFGGALFAAGLGSEPAEGGGGRIEIEQSVAGFEAYDSAGGSVASYGYQSGPVGVFAYTGNGAVFYGEASEGRLAIQSNRDGANPFWESSYVLCYARFLVHETFEASVSWDFGGWVEASVLVRDETFGQTLLEHTPATSPAGEMSITFLSGRRYSFNALIEGAAGGGDGFVVLPISDGLFTLHPQSQVVHAGGDATLTAGVIGRGGSGVRWHRDGVALVDGDGVSGASTLELTIDPAGYSHTGRYECYVDGDVSESAVLGVQPCIGGDANGDGAVDFSDLNAVLSEFGAGCGE